MSDASTLSAAVSQIEQQAERKEDAENVESRVESANKSLRRINRDLDDLGDAVEELQFYRRILGQAFDGSIPSGVRTALQQTEDVVETDRQDLVEILQDGSPEAFRQEINDAADAVKNAQNKVENRLRDRYWADWEDKISSAREVQRIVGSQNDEFGGVIDDIERHIKNHMQDPKQDARHVVSGWEKARSDWERHQDLQGLDAYQQEHGLSDEAIDVIQRLSQDSVALVEIDLDVLRELKGIPDLEAAIDLEI
jgi:hypothetical protein